MASLPVIDRPADEAHAPRELRDGVGRRIDHLRLSVTPACDLRCHYCRPARMTTVGGRPMMSLEQRLDVVSWLVFEHGLSKVRITGGEPLMADDVVELIAQLKRRHPDVPLVMTTNATRLRRFAGALRDAGLDRINLSLDTLRPARFASLTGGELAVVLDGIEAAREAGFAEFKINAVALRGVNDDEFGDLIEWACRNGDEMRFLEAMPIGPQMHYNGERFMSGAEMREVVARQFEMTTLPRDFGLTARRYAVGGRGVSGVVGFITPVTEPFCSDCRRLRITADGMLYPCLLDSRSFDLTPAWPPGATGSTHFDPRRAESILLDAVGGKKPVGKIQTTPMIALGG